MMKELAREIVDLAIKLQDLTDDDNDEQDIKNFNLFLEKSLEFRNLLEKKMKYSSPTKKQILRLQVIHLDNEIAQMKQKFKGFVEICEKQARIKAKYEKKLDKFLEQGESEMAKLYIIAKYHLPKAYHEELHVRLVENLTPEQVREFYKRVEHLDATQGEEIIAEDYK